ncbi:DUF2313 domain-containing protein [Photobacterium sp. WH24]|uniref:YmfQ family protein n=1 Tax=Photobacterium sp. WH24 TaxID=2827237 RepID=UPI001C488772|nr:putative phage tail protein [Photobacterium sp. WH24]MBV7262553.1 DUF2313 domain-containing protein [Photobacterium sp. WH24]
MVVSAQSRDAWLDVLQQLMPQGMAWSRDNDANQTKLLRALAKHLAELDTSCDSMAREMLPNQTQTLLEDYEQYLGLPECENASETITDRRQAVVMKDRRKGGLATWQIEQLAADLGFDVTVEEIFPHHCLRDCMYPLHPERYRHVLRVTVHNLPNARMTCLDHVLTPLVSNNAGILECTLNRYKLAGKYYEFIYEQQEAN